MITHSNKIKLNVHVDRDGSLSRYSPDVAPCKEIRIPEPGTFLLVEYGILLTIGIHNPNSTDTDWNPLPGIRDQRLGIQNPRLSWIPLHGAKKLT